MRAINKDMVLAEGATEEQYKRIVRMSQEVKKARAKAMEDYTSAIKKAQQELDFTHAEITSTYNRLFFMVLEGEFDKVPV